jgi:hypothetical protein
MDQSLPSTMQQGTEHIRVPTLKECQEFNRAADEWLMKRGITQTAKFYSDFEEKKSNKIEPISEKPDKE